MMKKIVNYFKCSKSGEIRMDVEITEEKILSFRIDAQLMQVEWGDIQATDHGRLTEQFSHSYHEKGIYHIIIRGENITGIDMPVCDCTKLDVTQCKSLEFINCSGNQLNELDIRNCKNLYELHCMNNQLESLELDKYSNLFYISCTSNRLKHINLLGCRKLVNLYCNRNCLQSLDVRNCRKLIIVNLEENDLSEEALIAFVASLKPKLNQPSGLVGISGISQSSLNNVRTYIHEKGWHEI